MPAATQSRQVRRAAERFAAKIANRDYPRAAQRSQPFQPRGDNYNDGRPLGQQEAARRLRRTSLSEAR